jgi:membrane protein implicated in regulation of membrane protease activity
MTSFGVASALMQFFEVPAMAWLTVAIVAAIIEVSVPHFGSAFVSAGAVAAAAVAYYEFSVAAQFGTFVAVLTASIVLLRSRILNRIGGPGVPSRTQPLIGKHAIVTHDVDTTIGTGRVNVGGEDWAARSTEPITTGAKVRIVGADGIVLEVTRV